MPDNSHSAAAAEGGSRPAEEPERLASPFNWQALLRRPRSRPDPVPFLDIILIGILFAMAGSRFLVAPGVRIDLPEAGHPAGGGVPAAAVLTVCQNDAVLFGGNIHPLASAAAPLREYAAKHDLGGAALLVKADRNVEVQKILTVCEAARQAGFGSVQIAAEEELPRRKLWNRGK